jgi:hypothetical protein
MEALWEVATAMRQMRRVKLRIKKMAARTNTGYLVGYQASNIFRIWYPQRVVTSRDVDFDEAIRYDPTAPRLEDQLLETTSRQEIIKYQSDLSEFKQTKDSSYEEDTDSESQPAGEMAETGK